MTGNTQYNLAAIRKLLLVAFTPDSLRRFCQDSRTLSPVVAKFGPGHGLDDMVDEVVDYCHMQLLCEELLAAVKTENPRQYARFEPYARASQPSLSDHLSHTKATLKLRQSPGLWIMAAMAGALVLLGMFLVMTFGPWADDETPVPFPTTPTAIESPTNTPLPTQTPPPHGAEETAQGVVEIVGDQNVVVGGVISGNVHVDIQNLPVTESPTDTSLYNAEIEGQNGNVIVAYNEARDPLWQREMDGSIAKLMTYDLDRNGSKEVIAGTRQPGSRPGWLFVFDQSGHLIAEYNTWKPTVYTGSAKDQMNVSDFQIADLTNDGTNEIVVISRDVYWYASRLAVLQLQQGEMSELAEYWNPGLLYTLHLGDTNGDNVQEVVCTGANNDLRAVLPLEGNVHVVFLLDGSTIQGQSPPWFGDAPYGSEIWYGYITPGSTRVSSVDFEDIDGNNLDEVHVTLSDVCSYYLNYDGDVVMLGRGSACSGESELHILRSSD